MNDVPINRRLAVCAQAADHGGAQKPLLVSDLGRLRAKLTRAAFPLSRYWAHFQQLAAANPVGEFQALPMFAWLVTGDRRYEANIRAVYLELMDKLPLCDSCVEAQYHTYTVGSPLARFAIYLDWVWDSGILGDEERARVAGRLVDQVYSHCYLTLKGRLPAGDNQQASMSFACAVVGYLFGVKRMPLRTAQAMYAEGLSRYFTVLRELPAGGWCGEGSAYHYGVVAPVLALFTAFVEAVTGQDHFDTQLGPSTVRETLRFAAGVINAAGLLPGWDDYGNMRPEIKTHLAWYARKSGDLAALDAIARHGMWSESMIWGWYNDDKVWTLLFWPDEAALPDTPPPPRPWLQREVAGKLIAADGTLDLLQMWDVAGGGIPSRAHLNPNSVEICTHGQVHTCDAHGLEADPRYFRFNPDVLFDERDRAAFASAIRMWQTSAENARMTEEELAAKVRARAAQMARACSDSTLAAHSVVTVDHEGWKFLREDVTGTGSGFVALPSLQALRGDVSEFYRKAWGLRRMVRSSLLIDNRLLLLWDSFAGPRRHAYTWRLQLRPEVTVGGCRARQRLREGVVLDVATEAGLAFEVQEIRNYPRYFERLTHSLSTTRTCASGRFAVVLRPGLARQVVADLSEAWSVRGGGETMPVDLFALPATADLAGEFYTAPFAEPTVWLGRTLTLDAAQAARAQRLAIRFRSLERLDVFVNGVQARPAFDHPGFDPTVRDVHKCVTPLSESHFDVAGLLHAGANRIAIASSHFRGQILSGPILLLELTESPDVPLAIARDGQFLRVEDGADRWLVAPDAGRPREMRLPGGAGSATAERLLYGKGTLALAHVTRAQFADWQCVSTRPVQLEVSAGRFHLDLTGETPAYVELVHGVGRLCVRSGCVTSVSGTLPGAGTGTGPRLLLRTGSSGPVFLNGECVVPAHAVEAWVEVAAPGAGSAPGRTESRYEPGFPPAAGEAGAERAALLAGLRSAEWRERVAAVQAVAWGRHRWAIPELVRLFEEEETRELYPPIRANWPLSKMLTSYLGEPDPPLPQDGQRRFRLKAVLLEAFGLLDAQAAAPLVRRTLERGTDFYPALVQACLAAGRLRLRECLPLLERWADHFEKNTRDMSVLAARRIRGEMTESAFEQAAGL